MDDYMTRLYGRLEEEAVGSRLCVRRRMSRLGVVGVGDAWFAVPHLGTGIGTRKLSEKV
jgi:hypothetical protein